MVAGPLPAAVAGVPFPVGTLRNPDTTFCPLFMVEVAMEDAPEIDDCMESKETAEIDDGAMAGFDG